MITLHSAEPKKQTFFEAGEVQIHFTAYAKLTVMMLYYILS